MMAPRLVELHAVLKETGSLYLHCDPAASHYLKVLLDAVFGPENFRNEIAWKRTSGHSDARRYGRAHDVILFYAKGPEPTWNQPYQPYDQHYVAQYYRYYDEGGRRFMSGDLGAAGLQGGGYEYSWRGVTRKWRVPVSTMQRLDTEGRVFYTRNGIPRIKRYLDEAKGMPAQDIWSDVEALRSWHQEKLGYPTQKPEALLERIIRTSSKKGDVVLDPFCGCGTAIAVAQREGRFWIGIDVAQAAIQIIRERLDKEHGPSIRSSYAVWGEPESLEDAETLAREDPYQFQWWAVRRLGAREVQRRKGADKGVDGRLILPTSIPGYDGFPEAIVSVKAGATGPAHVRELRGTLSREDAPIGVLVTLHPPTKAMRSEAASAGSCPGAPSVPRIQLLTAADIIDGDHVQFPKETAATAQVRASRQPRRSDQSRVRGSRR